MIRFASPWWLPAGAVLVAVHLWARGRAGTSLGVPSTRGTRRLSPSWAVRTRWVVPLLEAAALLLMTAALAGPRWGVSRVVHVTEGVSIVLAVDASESMGAVDPPPDGPGTSRLEAVKRVVAEFVARRTGDRIGVVVFGSTAYTLMPLTTDHRALTAALSRVRVGAAGPDTALGDGLGLALKRLRGVTSPSKVVILLTDGRSNAGMLSPGTAADIAHALGVRVHTVGIGRSGVVRITVPDPLGGTTTVTRRADLDETTLRGIAARTGGRFFRAGAPGELGPIYEAIDRLEKSESRVETRVAYREEYPVVLGVALALLLLAAGAANTRYLEIP